MTRARRGRVRRGRRHFVSLLIWEHRLLIALLSDGRLLRYPRRYSRDGGCNCCLWYRLVTSGDSIEDYFS